MRNKSEIGLYASVTLSIKREIAMIDVSRKPDPPRILIIDDDDGVNRVLSGLLSGEVSVSATTSVKNGLEIARKTSPFLAIIDLRMPEASGIEVLKEIKKINPDIKVMIMSAYGEVSSVVEIFKEGAIDFLAKPFNFKSLLENVRRLARSTTLDQQSREAQAKEIVGESPAMKEMWDLVKRIAPTDVPLFLQGETGTGKELFAKAIHDRSLRSNGPFVPVDCSALPESLIESELFGYEKGAFTGAGASKQGLLESADMGTLFLDEIGNLPLHVQAKLLRVIQDHKIIRLGAKGYEPIPLNMRIIAATNADLEEASRRGAFRSDLYSRLNVPALTLPPLRDRHGDIPLLANYVLAKCNQEFHRTLRITDEAMNLLNEYPWPGNIRELENVIKSACLISNDAIHPSHLTRIIVEKKRVGADSPAVHYDNFMDIKVLKNVAAEEAEREAILQIIKDSPFITKGRLAQILKVDPKTLRSKLKRYGFDALH